MHPSILRQGNKDFFWNAVGAYCRRCKYDECVSALQLHHINSEEKKGKMDSSGYWLSMNRTKLIERLLETKFTILYSNCHTKLHSVLREGRTVRLNPIDTDIFCHLSGREEFFRQIENIKKKKKQLSKQEKEDQWCRDERLKAGMPCKDVTCFGCKMTSLM